MRVSCPTFSTFGEMMEKSRPDMVIVTSVDNTHHTYIAGALAMGADVITEKPMTTDEEKLKIILEARKNSTKDIIVAHNYRYAPTRARIKELLLQERAFRGSPGETLCAFPLSLLTHLAPPMHPMVWIEQYHEVNDVATPPRET